MISWKAMSARQARNAVDWIARNIGAGGALPDRRAVNESDPRTRGLIEALINTGEDPALVEAMRLARASSPRRAAASRVGRRTPVFVGWALAAGLAAAAALVAIITTPALLPSFGAYETVRTARAEKQTITLADGSRITLNGDSQVAFRMTGRERSVRLDQGEAFFDVAHDPERPFRVLAGAARAEVLGTRFMLDRRADRTEILVHEGRVRFSPLKVGSGEAVIAAAGDRVRIVGGRIVERGRFDLAGGDWRSGWLETQDMTLGDLVVELNRWSTRPILLEGDVGRKRISGRFRLERPEQQLENLARLHGLELRRAPNGYFLRAPRDRVTETSQKTESDRAAPPV